MEGERGVVSVCAHLRTERCIYYRKYQLQITQHFQYKYTQSQICGNYKGTRYVRPWLTVSPAMLLNCCYVERTSSDWLPGSPPPDWLPGSPPPAPKASKASLRLVPPPALCVTWPRGGGGLVTPDWPPANRADNKNIYINKVQRQIVLILDANQDTLRTNVRIEIFSLL